MAVSLNAVRTVAALVLLAAPVHAQTESDPPRFRDCSTYPEMVVVPGGHFMRGSPPDEPGRDLDSRNHDEDDLEGPGGKRVRVSVPAFALGVFEVTNDQFTRFVEDSGYEMPGGCISDPDGDGVWAAEEAGTWKNLGREFRGDFPASCIDWHAANAYVHGSACVPAAGTGCRPRPSSNTLCGPAATRRTTSATTRSCASTETSRTSPATRSRRSWSQRRAATVRPRSTAEW